MNIKAMQLVFNKSNTKGMDRMIMLYLAWRSAANLISRLFLNDIAEKAMINPASVPKALSRLVKFGELSHAGDGADGTCCYRITLADH